jgi:hypothetical protein
MEGLDIMLTSKESICLLLGFFAGITASGLAMNLDAKREREIQKYLEEVSGNGS